MQNILVFVLRHGEREDEALYDAWNRTAYKELNREDKVDPYLTVKGHRQAAVALENLVSSLRAAHIERVIIFSSPMRRVMGTIMMLAPAIGTVQGHDRTRSVIGEREHLEYSGISFGLPSAANEKDDDIEKRTTAIRDIESDETGTRIIPIVVHNGLCQCTALVGRLGGHKKVIRTGIVRCAAMEANSVSNKQSPVRKELVAMKSRAVEALDSYSDVPSDTQLQFWMIKDEKLLPMTRPISLKRHNIQEEDQEDERPYEIMACPVVLHDSEPPIDQVVRMAMTAGYDACVVASHREEIRDLVEKRCKSKHDVDDIPYCAIGMFEAWLDGVGSTEKDDNGQTVNSGQELQWALHNIAAPEDLHNMRVSDMLSRPNVVPYKQVEILWSVIERTMLRLCQGRLIIDNIASESSVAGICSCRLTGAGRKLPTELNGPRCQPSPLTLTVEITQGHHSWLQFLGRLRCDIAYGTIELEHCNNLVPSKYTVVLRPDRQPQLPCPPKVLYLDVFL
jgi:broad specificity phosphatase PhoE